MIHARYCIVMVILAGPLVSGCSNGGFKDAMGMGKYSPDETQVSANEALAMPPSLQLPSPKAGGEEPADAGSGPQSLSAPQRVTANPPNYGTPDPNEAPPSQAVEEQPAEPQKLAATSPQQPQQIVEDTPAAPDVYDKLGISKVHPDGRQKTQGELINELRKKRIEEKRKKDPGYGSIFNVPKVWNE